MKDWPRVNCALNQGQLSLALLVDCALAGAAVGYYVFSYHADVFIVVLFPEVAGTNPFDSVGFIMRAGDYLYWPAFGEFGWFSLIEIFALPGTVKRLFFEGGNEPLLIGPRMARMYSSLTAQSCAHSPQDRVVGLVRFILLPLLYPPHFCGKPLPLLLRSFRVGNSR